MEDTCEECGNDLACEGYRFCSECLEMLGHEADKHPKEPSTTY